MKLYLRESAKFDWQEVKKITSDNDKEILRIVHDEIKLFCEEANCNKCEYRIEGEASVKKVIDCGLGALFG